MRFHEVKSFSENQAFSALLFLYKEVLGVDMSEWNIQALRAQERKHIPVVLTREEVKSILQNLGGIYQLIVSPMYGCGLRMNKAFIYHMHLKKNFQMPSLKQSGSFFFLYEKR